MRIENGRRMIGGSPSNRTQSSLRLKAEKIKTQADIVFCIDATGSMAPCFEGVKQALNEFVEGLQSAADVDYRLRLIAYRDLHDPTGGVPWQTFSFTSSPDQFKSEVAGLTAEGGGSAASGAESTLDALYVAMTKSDWRSATTHKTIVLFTDADTHKNLHSSTYSRPDNGVERVIQEFQTLKHVLLFIVAPEYPTYLRLEKAGALADRKVIAEFLPIGDEKYQGLRAVDWSTLMKLIGQKVSVSSIAASQR